MPLSGGILSLVLIIFFENIDYLNKFYFFNFLIGVMSDTNKVNSPIIRLLSQVIIVAILLIKNETYVIDTRFEPIDLLINDFFYFKIFFSIFFFLVLINGSNFIDGVNTLFSGYYLIVSLVILYILKNFQINETLNIFLLINFLLIFCLLILSQSLFR